MKKIGQGWQYATYSIDDDRVLKRFNSWWSAAFIIFRDIFPFRNKLFFWRTPLYIRTMCTKAEHSREIMSRRRIPKAWLGNPRFLDGLDYEQDRVTPIGEALKKMSTVEAKKIIDSFVVFNQQLLKRGIIEKSFSIAKNFGLTKQGQVVLLDLGEILEGETMLERQRKKRAWAAPYVIRELKNKQVRNYFIQQMDKHFATKNRVWSPVFFWN